MAYLLEFPPAKVPPEIIGGQIIRHVEIHAAVFVEVGGYHAQTPAIGIADSRLRGHVDEPALVVTKEVVGSSLEIQGITRDIRTVGLVAAKLGIVSIPDGVMADIKVEIAIAIEISEGSRGWPVSITAQPSALGHVLERPITPVAQQPVAAPPGQEQVGMAVVVVIGHGDAVTIGPGELGQAGTMSHVSECAVATIPEQAVARAWPAGYGRECSALSDEDIHPAVAVEIQQADSAPGRLGNLVDLRLSIAILESQPGRICIINEPKRSTGFRLGV